MDPNAPKERARRLAAGQAGRVAFAQLIHVGLTAQEVKGWISRHELTRVLPRVYALGNTAPSFIARLWEAVLFAGPGACLTAAAAAYQRGLLIYEPKVIHVATPRDVRKIPRGINVLNSRQYPRKLVDGIPVAPIPEMMLDLAATADFSLVRRALSVLDYQGELDLSPLLAVCGRGHRGSRALRKAIALHQPELAHVRGPGEEYFLLWLEAEGFEIPKFNRKRFGVDPGRDLRRAQPRDRAR